MPRTLEPGTRALPVPALPAERPRADADASPDSMLCLMREPRLRFQARRNAPPDWR